MNKNKNKNKKGGSIASNRVNALSPKLCNTNKISNTVNQNTTPDKCFLLNNYSSIYKTTGGKSKKYTKKGGSIASNRVNALSPKLCNTNKIQYPVNKNTQLNKCFLFNNYSSNYKTTGGKKKTIKTRKNTKGGRVLLPMRYFNPNYYGNYIKQNINGNYYTNDNIIDNTVIKYTNCGGKKTKKHKGGNISGKWWPLNRGNPGDSMLTGSEIPRTIPQKIKNYFDGKSPILTDHRSDPSYSPNLQLNNNNCSVVNNDIINSNSPLNGIGDIPYTTGSTFKKHNIEPSLKASDFNIPFMRAGAGRKTKKKGGGSDWLSSVYSRGSYTSPNMTEQQFKSFNKSSPYIPNIKLANGAASHFKPSEFIYSNELLGSNKHTPPMGYNELDGLPIKQFGKGKKNNKFLI